MFGSIGESVSDMSGPIGEIISDMFGSLGGAIPDMFGSLGESNSDMFGSIKESMSDVFGSIKERSSDVFTSSEASAQDVFRQTTHGAATLHAIMVQCVEHILPQTSEIHPNTSRMTLNALYNARTTQKARINILDRFEKFKMARRLHPTSTFGFALSISDKLRTEAISIGFRGL